MTTADIAQEEAQEVFVRFFFFPLSSLRMVMAKRISSKIKKKKSQQLAFSLPVPPFSMMPLLKYLGRFGVIHFPFCGSHLSRELPPICPQAPKCLSKPLLLSGSCQRKLPAQELDLRKVFCIRGFWCHTENQGTATTDCFSVQWLSITRWLPDPYLTSVSCTACSAEIKTEGGCKSQKKMCNDRAAIRVKDTLWRLPFADLRSRHK